MRHLSSTSLRLLSCLLVCACAIALIPPAHAQTALPPPLIVLGDSLADNGNVFRQTGGQVPPATTYYLGRFSNGPVAVEYLWGLLNQNLPGSQQGVQPALSIRRLNAGQSVNLAFSGAGTGVVSRTPGGFSVPGLLGQVAMLKELRPSRTTAAAALYVIMVGSNDYLMAPINTAITPEASTKNILLAIRRLHALGGRTFMVLNLPDLGVVPLVPRDPRLSSSALTQASREHNRLLANKLAALSTSLPHARIIAADLALAAQGLQGMEMWQPAIEYLFPDFPQPGAGMCLFLNPASCPVVSDFNAAPAHFYWDVLHPTTTVHWGLAQFLFNLLR